MFEALKSFFSSQKNSDSQSITDFSEAVSWIKTYQKAENFDVAIFAARELTLKTKTSINYYEEVLKKLMFLEASNIENVSKTAIEKRKKIDSNLAEYYKRLKTLEKLIADIEKNKQKEEEKRKRNLHKMEIQAGIEMVNTCVKKKEYDRAVAFAKKLVADFPDSKQATNVLSKMQKLHESQKTKAQKQQEKHDKINKMLQEVGVEADELKNKTSASLFARARLFLKQMKLREMEKKEYVERQKALKGIEQLLIKSGTIENVKNDNKNDELFSIMNSGLSKDVGDFSLHGFDFFGRIIGKDKIVGDTFGYHRDGNRTVFYLGDATGHGIQAGFTVALLSKLFFELTKKTKTFADLFLSLNNQLKEGIKGRLFVTAIFFEFDSTTNRLNFIGAGHDPIFWYHKKTDTVERVVPGGLAMWVRMIQNVGSIKTRDLKLEHGDVLLGYTDGIVETKNANGAMYSLDRLEKSFTAHAKKIGHAPDKLYAAIMKDVDDFRESISFGDDVSMFIFARNTGKDLIGNKAELESLLKEMDMRKDAKEISFKNKTRQQIIEEMKRERYERDLKIRLDRLERLYKMQEFTKLKQEVWLYFREWFAHDRMRFYLEKALENEQKMIVRKQEERLQRKYDTLTELYKKGEYELVIKETIDVLFKNGKI